MEKSRTIKNLKLSVRRTKGFYEVNKKKPGLFSINSAKIASPRIREESFMNVRFVFKDSDFCYIDKTG